MDSDSPAPAAPLPADVADRVRSLLDGHLGHRTTDDLAAALDVDPDALDARLEHDDRDLLWRDDEWAHAPTLLDGLVAAHVLTDADVADGVLHPSPDLALLDLPNAGPGGSSSPAGIELRLVAGEHHHRLPPGTLDGAAPGDVVVLTAGRSDDVWTLAVHGPEHVEQPTDADADAVRAAAARLHEDDRRAELADLVAELAVTGRDTVTRPVPLGRLLAHAGLATHGDWLVPHGEDPVAWHRAWRQDLVDPTGELPEDVVDGAIDVLDALRPPPRSDDDADGGDGGDGDAPVAVPGAAGVSADADVLRRADAALADADVHLLVASHLLQVDGDEQPLRALVAGLAGASTSPSAGTLTLTALVAEMDGDVAAEQRALDAALGVDPGFVPAVLGAVRLREDAGDAAGALRLLRRLGMADDDVVAGLLRALTSTPWPDAGRNEPCPCGSGRKHKRCHDGPDRPIEVGEREAWLVERLREWERRTAQGPAVRAALQPLGWRAMAPQLALEDPMLDAVGLFALGLVDVYLARRGALLGEQDRALVASWASTPRLDVVEADAAGHATSLLDGRTHALGEGDRALLAEVLGEDDVAALAVVLLPRAELDVEELEGFLPLTAEEADDARAAADGGADAVTWFATLLSAHDAEPG